MLKDCLGTKVILANKKNRGKIIIEYYSDDELDRIVETFSSIKVHSE
jgi:ParB family chromosome partitioning protein